MTERVFIPSTVPWKHSKGNSSFFRPLLACNDDVAIQNLKRIDHYCHRYTKRRLNFNSLTKLSFSVTLLEIFPESDGNERWSEMRILHLWSASSLNRAWVGLIGKVYQERNCKCEPTLWKSKFMHPFYVNGPESNLLLQLDERWKKLHWTVLKLHNEFFQRFELFSGK